MAVLTWKVLASVLHMHGPDATITSDNRGIDALLADIRGQITERADTPRVMLAAKDYKKGFGKTIFRKGDYGKTVYGPQFKNVFQ